MSVPTKRPFNESHIHVQSSSIATTPVDALVIATVTGYVQRGFAGSGGTTTGTITVAVEINGGSDIFGGALTIAAGAGNANNPAVELPLTGSNVAFVTEGDVIKFVPSGGTGSSIPGAFGLVIREL